MEFKVFEYTTDSSAKELEKLLNSGWVIVNSASRAISCDGSASYVDGLVEGSIIYVLSKINYADSK